jgi:predicted TIM-barrel fold metal-dependent hydrolase
MDFETYIPTDKPADERAAVLAEILADADRAGIEYVVTMPSPTWVLNNRALHETVGGERRAIACCQVNPNNGADAVQDFVESVTQRNMKLLKLMPAAYHLNLLGPIVATLMDKARDLGVVVNIHSGGNNSHPLAIGALARRFPEVPIIMDHMGYREWGGDAIAAARDNPNIYLGTTIASNEPSSVVGAIKALGPERVIYGSNAPALYSDLAVTALKRQKLGQEVEELLFGGNLARILKM